MYVTVHNRRIVLWSVHVDETPPWPHIHLDPRSAIETAAQLTAAAAPLLFGEAKARALTDMNTRFDGREN